MKAMLNNVFYLASSTYVGKTKQCLFPSHKTQVMFTGSHRGQHPLYENQSHATAGNVIFKLFIGLGPCPVLQILKVLETFRVYHCTGRESVIKTNDP